MDEEIRDIDDESQWSSFGVDDLHSESERSVDDAEQMQNVVEPLQEAVEIKSVCYTRLSEEDSCAVCYSSLKSLIDEAKDAKQDRAVAIQCPSCECTQCMTCIAEWAVATIQKLHIPESHSQISQGNSGSTHGDNSVDDLFKLKCAQNGCDNIFTVKNLQSSLPPEHFEQVSLAITKRVLQASDSFVACPNSNCHSFGFYEQQGQEHESFNEVQCDTAFECSSCEFTWCTAAQKKASLSFFSLTYWKDFELVELPIFTNLYKSFCSEKCPSCNVLIVRTGGCKFMTCSKCNYQFCWYCLDEFYTEYHYNVSDCPFRIILFYSLLVFCCVFLYVKLLILSPQFLVWNLSALQWFIELAIGFGLFAMYFNRIDKSQVDADTRALKVIRRIPQMYLSNRERRQKNRLEQSIKAAKQKSLSTIVCVGCLYLFIIFNQQRLGVNPKLILIVFIICNFLMKLENFQEVPAEQEAEQQN